MGTRARILIVDDEPLNVDLLEQELEELEYETINAGDGKEALEKIETDCPDLVLLDVMMPVMDGYEVLKRLQAAGTLGYIPVIMVSALDEMGSVVRCIEIGAEDYLTKPVNAVLLRARISASLEKKSLREREVAYLTELKQTEEALRKTAEQAKANLSRYFSPNLAHQLATDPGSLNLDGERRDLSFLFTDLADFTPLVETLEPPVVISLLNEYLDELTRIVFHHEGTVDKIVGDAVHAMFGAPLEQADHAARAVHCAMDIDAFCEDFRKRQIAAGVPLGITRIGVHSGAAIVGNFGGALYFDYTAHGDAINTAARLESANKYLGTRVCVSIDVVERIPDFEGRPVGTLVLKGRADGLKVFEPLSTEQALSPATRCYREAFALLEVGNASASQAFAAIVGRYGEDPLATFHLRRLLGGQCSPQIEFSEK